MNEEREEELRRLADKLGYFGIESQASDAIKELLKEVDRLQSAWQEEHTARVRLEERLKAAEQQAQYWHDEHIEEWATNQLGL